MTPYYTRDGITLYLGDCLDVLPTLEAGSIDAVVTDPPYELGFMARGWDKSGIANNVELWTQILRVAKPGAHLLAFGGTRTYHRMTCAIEDAGWEIRDCIQWVYATGFPKSHNLPGGLGTALKPAHEPIVLARKPLRGTVAANVTEFGTGALNIDRARIEAVRGDISEKWLGGEYPKSTALSGGLDGSLNRGINPPHAAGRWPANLVLSHAETCELRGTKVVRGVNVPGPGLADHSRSWEGGYGPRAANYHTDSDGLETVEDWRCAIGCPVAELDQQSGVRAVGGSLTGSEPSRPALNTYGEYSERRVFESYADTGGASRFFFVARPDSSELNSSEHVSYNEANGGSPWESTDHDPSTPAGWDTQRRRDTTDSPSGILPQRALDQFSGTSGSGNRQTVLFPQDSKSTIETRTNKTTDSKTSNSSTPSPTSDSIADAFAPTMEDGSNHAASAVNSNSSGPKTGTSAQRDGPSTDAADPAISSTSLPVNSGDVPAFLYVPKASSRERSAGLEQRTPHKVNDGRRTPIDNPYQRGETPRRSTHPTVKPVELMRYLIRLITPPGGIVCDPFMGSGSTKIAAVAEGAQFIGIEQSEEYCAIAASRLAQAGMPL